MHPTRNWQESIGRPEGLCAEASVSAPTHLENLLRRDRWLIGLALTVIISLCWAWLVPMARDMYGPMTGASAWMMTETWDFPHQALLFAMWAVMMVGMMLPSVTPTLLLYAAVVHKGDPSAAASTRVYSFAGGYLLVWTVFSLLATVLQLLLHRCLLLSPMMETSSQVLGGALLMLAGAYQFTSYKRTCLESCRSPAAFIAQHWRPGVTGAFRLGLDHGVYCLGCCWALMLLLFVGGVMNLWWIGLLTLFVLLEKVAPLGAKGGRLSGVLIIALGIWRIARG
jgi:predicted metal-binding membrane protein